MLRKDSETTEQERTDEGRDSRGIRNNESAIVVALSVRRQISAISECFIPPEKARLLDWQKRRRRMH